MGWAIEPLRKYATFSGRSRRKEYWLFVLFVIVVSLVLSGIDAAKLRDVPRWRDSDRFTDQERQVIAYAEAMTTTPLEVTDRSPRRV